MSSQVPTGEGLQKHDMMAAVRDREVDREGGEMVGKERIRNGDRQNV